MDHTHGTSSTSRQFRSFFIQDILEFPKEEMPKGKNDVVNSQVEKERIQNLNVQEKKKLDFGKKKSECKKVAAMRSLFQDKQRRILEKHFERSKYLTQRERGKIADEAALTDRQVKTWFQNRRTRWRKVNGNKGLAKIDRSQACKIHVQPGEILSNFSERLSVDYVSQLHKHLGGK